jgi:hypothetical protein
VSGDAASPDDFLDLVGRVAAFDPRLSELQAAMLTAAHLGVASDSRSFANKLGVAHALVLRELSAFEDIADMLVVTKRDPRTMRAHYELGPAGTALFAG